ncbi:hypothetical protein MRX96_024536 [Rhipicephalus microplus]
MEATDRNGDPQQLTCILHFERAGRHQLRRRLVTAHRQGVEARTSMLPVLELLTHRAKDQVFSGLPKGGVQALDYSDQPAASCERPGARILKGCEWLSYAVTHM